MNIPKNLVAFICLLLLAGCASDALMTEKSTSLTDEEIEFLKKLDDPEFGSSKEEVSTLFPHLDQILVEWRNCSVKKSDKKSMKIYSNIEGILTRKVYTNFDKILDQLENGIQPNKVIAAAALGFSKIPDHPDFEQVYPKAISPLLRALESGDDAIMQNALIGLWMLKDTSTAIDTILPIMTQHHNPQVRANAALCLAAVVTPPQSDHVVPYVLPALRDEDPKVRLHAIGVIKALESKDLVTPLLDLMEDRYDLIRANAVQALGEMNDKNVCGVLIKNLNRSEVLKSACKEALVKLTDEDFGYDLDDWAKWWKKNKMKIRNQ